MDKKTQFKDIVKSCETHFNRGSSDDWKHGDFNDFSREILKATKVNISTNTLKRIFGKISVDDYYLPQQATIDALKKYSGYVESEVCNDTEEIKSESFVKSSSVILTKSLFLWSVLIILLIISIFYFVTKNTSEKIYSGNIKLTGTEGLLPKTAFFDLQLPDVKDSVFVDFGDKSDLVYIEPEQNNVSHIYLFPGIFKVRLKSSDNFVGESMVSVPSNQWLGLGYYRQHDIPKKHYAFPVIKKKNDTLFYISNKQLNKEGLDTLNSYFTRLCNYTKTGYRSDNFIFETSFKQALFKKGIYCSSMQFEISGLSNKIRFNLVSSGCSSRVLNVISEQTFRGTKTNLSQFVLNLDKWNTVKLINRNKKLSLIVNGKLLFKGTYKEPLGEIKGVFVEFEGNGYIKNCDLKSLDGRFLYHF